MLQLRMHFSVLIADIVRCSLLTLKSLNLFIKLEVAPGIPHTSFVRDFSSAILSMSLVNKYLDSIKADWRTMRLCTPVPPGKGKTCGMCPMKMLAEVRLEDLML